MASPVVFVVDGDGAARTARASLIDPLDIGVRCYPSAEAFLDAYDPLLPACLVLEVRLPGINGFALQQRLMDIAAGLPVIFVCGHGDVAMSVRALRNGAIDFFEKPYRPRHMLARIQLALESVQQSYPGRARRVQLREQIKLLSPRERDVLGRLLQGDVSKVIARELNITIRTVDTHRGRIKHKLVCHSAAALVRDMVLTFGTDILRAPELRPR